MQNCLDHLEDVIEMCKLFDVPEQQFWDPILALAKQDNSKIPQLLDYVDSYKKPHRILRSFDDTTTLEHMRGPIMETF